MQEMYLICPECGTSFKQGERHACAARITDRDPLLVEREKTHGSFKENADLWEKLCQTGRFNRLNNAQKLAMSMIYLKIARMAQNPNEKDHWKDISGYALLGMEACE